MDDNDSERICASILWTDDLVQSGSTGGWCYLGNGQTDSYCGVAGHGVERRTELRDVPPRTVASGMVGLGGQRHSAAVAGQDLRQRRGGGILGWRGEFDAAWGREVCG